MTFVASLSRSAHAFLNTQSRKINDGNEAKPGAVLRANEVKMANQPFVSFSLVLVLVFCSEGSRRNDVFGKHYK